MSRDSASSPQLELCSQSRERKIGVHWTLRRDKEGAVDAAKVAIDDAQCQRHLVSYQMA